MNDKLILQNNLRLYRNKVNLSQQQLADIVGTTRQTIIAIEKKLFNPSAKLALLLSLALNCHFEDLFYF